VVAPAGTVTLEVRCCPRCYSKRHLRATVELARLNVTVPWRNSRLQHSLGSRKARREWAGEEARCHP